LIAELPSQPVKLIDESLQFYRWLGEAANLPDHAFVAAPFVAEAADAVYGEGVWVSPKNARH
jgi:hypothetical protein